MLTAIISDLHLHKESHLNYQLFKKFVDEMRPKLHRLYIIGDLFEFWIGDDDSSSFNQKVVTRLKSLSNSGIELFFMHGNRDFLIGKEFLKQTGMQLLKDPTEIDLGQTTVILTHGDLLCTEDKHYQRYRKIVHNPLIQKIFLALPLTLRRKIAEKLRKTSQQSMQKKPTPYLDVSEQAVTSVLAETQAQILIHGHTHHLGVHQINDKQQRMVLGAWHVNGSVILCGNNKPPELIEFNLQSLI